ncbi:hypothetical protein SAMN02745866_04310 [Alteromonadaceae bacterium Bs31]|nr:hypothetical protein SAMN02745866_04310 [Alteromonadaceae bacterium Bs31]
MNIPEEHDWKIDSQDLDEKYSFEKYLGKSKEQAIALFRSSPLECSFEIAYMPEIPFRYYVLAFKEFVEKSNKEEYDDVYHAYISMILSMIKNNFGYIEPLKKELLPLAYKITIDQEKYGLDLDIFGDLKVKLDEALIAAST